LIITGITVLSTFAVTRSSKLGKQPYWLTVFSAPSDYNQQHRKDARNTPPATDAKANLPPAQRLRL